MKRKIVDKEEREKILCKQLQHIEESRKNGQKGYSPEEVYDILGKVIEKIEQS